MDPDQIKEVRLSCIVALGKGAGLSNSPTNLNDKNRAVGPSPGFPTGSHLTKRK